MFVSRHLVSDAVFFFFPFSTHLDSLFIDPNEIQTRAHAVHVYARRHWDSNVWRRVKKKGRFRSDVPASSVSILQSERCEEERKMCEGGKKKKGEEKEEEARNPAGRQRAGIAARRANISFIYHTGKKKNETCRVRRRGEGR